VLPGASIGEGARVATVLLDYLKAPSGVRRNSISVIGKSHSWNKVVVPVVEVIEKWARCDADAPPTHQT
jgi:hypothetical protein